jgi:serine/threonine protein kinase
MAAPQFTPAYAAPEVLLAYEQKFPFAADPSQDIWAVGVMLYEALTCSKAAPPGTSTAGYLELARGDRAYPWEAAVLDADFERSKVRCK